MNLLRQGDGVVVVVNDREVGVKDWRATTVANAGYLDAEGTLEAAVAKRFDQNSKITWYRPDGDVLWQGLLTKRPTFKAGEARFVASGNGVRVADSDIDLAYQLRDYAMWIPGDSEPYNRAVTGDMAMSNEGGRLHWSSPGIASGEYLLPIVADDPILATRIAFTVLGLSPTVSINIRRFNPANQAEETNIASFGSGTTSVDQAIPTDADDDETVLVLRVDAGSDGCNVTVRALRVNFRAPGDIYTTTEVIKNSGALVGVDVRDVQASGVNALPLFWQGSVPELWDEMAKLDDRGWLVMEERRGSLPALDYRNYEDTVWSIAQERGLALDYDEIPRYDKVVVRWVNLAGVGERAIEKLPPQFVTAPSPKPLRVDLPGQWPDDRIPRLVARRYLERFKRRQITASLKLHTARLFGQDRSPYAVQPVTSCVIDDLDPQIEDDLGRPLPQRIVAVTYRPRGEVEAQIGQDYSPERILSLQALADARSVVYTRSEEIQLLQARLAAIPRRRQG